MKLLFIRHAESIGNQEKRMQGHALFTLSSIGEQQAQKLAHRLLMEHWWPTQIYSSPLERAAQTTKILLEAFVQSNLGETTSATTIHPAIKIPSIHYVDELQEFQNGIFQGLTWTEAQQQYPELCQALESSPDWLPIPGAESLEAGRDRAQRFIQMLLHTHQDSDAIWIVTHHWILQHLLAELLGCDRTWKFPAGYTALFEFWLDLSRWQRQDLNLLNGELWQIRRFNDCSHANSLSRMKRGIGVDG